MQKFNYQGNEKIRLDKFLKEQLNNLSRSQIQKLINNGKIKVNNQEVPVHYFLKNNDLINIEEIREKIKKKKSIKIPIIFENDDYFIINKPVGLAVEGAPKEYCLSDWLKERNLTKTKDEEFNSRAGLIHRLDKDVSGVMLVAKTPEFFNHLKSQFKKRSVKKFYLALVYGSINQDEGKLDFLMARNKDGKMVARPISQEGKKAITEYKVLKRFKNYTFVEVKILTGRTHQIRVHFYAYDHPVVGDKLYTQKKIKCPTGLKRLFLHSQIIGFSDLENHWQEYKIDLPSELKNILKILK